MFGRHLECVAPRYLFVRHSPVRQADFRSGSLQKTVMQKSNFFSSFFSKSSGTSTTAIFPSGSFSAAAAIPFRLRVYCAAHDFLRALRRRKKPAFAISCAIRFAVGSVCAFADRAFDRRDHFGVVFESGVREFGRRRALPHRVRRKPAPPPISRSPFRPSMLL